MHLCATVERSEFAVRWSAGLRQWAKKDRPLEKKVDGGVRCRPGLRHAAVLGVVRERLGEISVQPRPSARRPTLKAVDRAHALVDPKRAEGARHVGEIDVALDMHIGCTMAKGSRLQRDDVLLPHAIQLGSERARADLVLGRGGLDRDDHIALDLDDAARSRRLKLVRHAFCGLR